MIYNIPLPRVLDANMNELRRLDTLHASVTLSLEPLSTATLTLPDRETLSIRNWVELYTSMGSAGIYRVRAPSHNYRRDQKEYQLDHGIAEIGDYIIKDDLEIDSSPASTVIPQIFASYTGTLWQLGTIAAQDTVSYNGSHEDVLSAILRVLADLPDYCLSVNQSSLPWTLSVVQKPQTVTAEGRLARNIESCKISEDDQNLCTRIISPDLTGGKLDADTISLYGIVEHYAGKDDDTPQAQFEADCARYLAQHKNPLLSIQIDLLDLHQATGEAYDRAELGAMYRLALPDYNVTQQQTITKLNWPDVYGDPGRVKVTLANEEYTLSRAFHSSNASSSSAIEKTSKETAKNKYRWEATDKHVTDQGTILHKAGLEIDAHGVWLYASEHGADYALGSSFKVQADNIAAEVTRATAAEGTMSAQLNVQAGQISSKVSQTDYNGNTIASLINQTATTILIQAAHINLDGYVTANQFDALSASFNNLISGNLAASKITATAGNFSNLEITNSLVYGGYGDLKGKIINAFSSSPSGGTITISSTTLDGSAGPSVTFNIADTQFYRDAVASAYNDGWDAARGYVSAPSAGTNASMTVGIPASTVNQGSSYDFTVSADNSYAYIKNAVNTVVARVSNPAYGNGWDAARAKVSAPTAGTNATMTVGIPASTVNQGSSYDFTVSVDNNYAYIKNAVNTTVARVSNSAYNAGWAAAAAKFRRVGNYVYGPSSTVGGESSYHASIGGSHDYSASSFVHGGTTENSSWSGVINGISVTYTKSSHSSALAIVWS